MAFNVPKACAVHPKADRHIPSSPTYISSDGDVSKVERPVQKSTRSNVPGSHEESANAVKVVIPLDTPDSIPCTVTAGSMQKTGSEVSNLHQESTKVLIAPVPSVTTQPDAHKESTHSVKALISTLTPDSTTVTSINFDKPALPIVPVGPSGTCIFTDSDIPGTTAHTHAPVISADPHHRAALVPTTSDCISSLDSSAAHPAHGPSPGAPVHEAIQSSNKSDKQDGGKCCKFRYMHP